MRWRATITALSTLGAVHCGAAGAPEPVSRVGSSGGAASRDAVATALPRMVMPPFLVGYNEGWFGSRYGADLTTDYDPVLVRATLDGIVEAGGRVVRLWLFEGREGIVLGPSAPQIRGLDPKLLEHLGEVLAAARARGLWVYLTLLDGNEMPADAGPKRDFFRNLLNDELGEGAAFREKVIAPLLAMLSTRREVVYGLDLINEIAAPRMRGFWPEPLLAPRAFIQRTTSFIKAKAPWLKVTASAGWDTAAADISTGFFSGLGLDFYDLHAYSDAGTIDGSNEVCSRAAQDGVPVILGEFGQRSHVSDDALQQSSTAAFLANAKSGCFRGALAWRYDAAEKWWDFVRDDGTHRPAVRVIQQFASAP